MTAATRPFAIVTGASTGIGYALAKECLEHGFDLVIAADEPAIEQCRGTFCTSWPAVQRHAVGDDEGWIDLSLFNALHQFGEVVPHRCLGHAECQATIDGTAHGDLV